MTMCIYELVGNSSKILAFSTKVVFDSCFTYPTLEGHISLKMQLFSNGFFPLILEMLFLRLVYYMGKFITRQWRKLPLIILFGTPLIYMKKIDYS